VVCTAVLREDGEKVFFEKYRFSMTVTGMDTATGTGMGTGLALSQRTPFMSNLIKIFIHSAPIVGRLSKKTNEAVYWSYVHLYFF